MGKDKTKQNISLIKDAYRISLGRNAKIIQCGWRRHHTPETRKKHLVGYKKVNLHLPIYQMTTPIKFKNKIYIPYDLVLMDKKQKEILSALITIIVVVSLITLNPKELSI